MSTYPVPDNPATRKEMYLAKAAGKSIEIPEPMTREEMYLAAIAENGGGGGTGGVENLSELHDVNISNLQDGDFIVYDEATGKYINKQAEAVIVNYENADNKPTINGVEISGDMTAEDSGLASTVDEPTETLIIGGGI